ncbi:hypothetical protein [Membranihabitans marinus]|uniref:hypothetical protein n=1 Tax=Membranihabitans marinus TaxID=1227546 RepID=UPI001F390DC7|nr:hypothetical protein [Membranihabitans marinus]
MNVLKWVLCLGKKNSLQSNKKFQLEKWIGRDRHRDVLFKFNRSAIVVNTSIVWGSVYPEMEAVFIHYQRNTY